MTSESAVVMAIQLDRSFRGEGELQWRHAYSRQTYAIACEPSVESSWCLPPFASLLIRKFNVKSEVELRRLGHDVVPSCQSAQADALQNVCAETSTSSLLVVTVWCLEVVKDFVTVETRSDVTSQATTFDVVVLCQKAQVVPLEVFWTESSTSSL